MSRQSCMGGFQCPVRDRCTHYTAEGPQRARPAERLCELGTTDAFEPIKWAIIPVKEAV